MKDKYVIFTVLSIFFSFIFGAIAYQQFYAEKMDEVYLNIAYCTLFLSIAIYLWHMKDEKRKDNS
ncbi:protein YpmT [Metabacillus sediminilitoris]|uniref:Protein YpmT n=1 Tax=Metabacillus sediminilitoris TaxID=2567941 RepID=A0A4V3WEE6_9BACI|nr:protein YpmT [Metabacillus sediminilitoris]QGQ46579.1 hypothetical protein GMB29_15960 [Metabacillus sediminilitoris]THF75976.1 hypothetical protein E6W99_22465 [Metabacillus sediminilitoris]